MTLPEHGTPDRYVDANTNGSGGGGGGGGSGNCILVLVAEDGTTNGATPVTILGPPAATHQLRNVLTTIRNRDTVPTTIFLNKDSAGGTRQVWSGTLYVGDTLFFDDLLVLDDSNSSVQLVLAAPIATNELDWTTSAIDSVPV